MFDNSSFTLNGCDRAIAMVGAGDEEVDSLSFDVSDGNSKGGKSHTWQSLYDTLSIW